MVKAEFFYANYGMVSSTDPVWLQSEFDTLMGLFYRVVLRTNIRKTVGVVFRPCQTAGLQADKSYTQRITG